MEQTQVLHSKPLHIVHTHANGKKKLSDVPLQASKLHICTLHLACKFLEMLPKVHLYPCLSLCINETKKTGTAWVLKFGKGGTLVLSSLWVC